jgi:Zn-dependent M32 family carboxypeptidase
MHSQERSLIQSFMAQAQELTELKSVIQTLEWDQETMMPVLGSPLRARQLSGPGTPEHR